MAGRISPVIDSPPVRGGDRAPWEGMDSRFSEAASSSDSSDEDVTTMQEAIQTGVPEAVETLLDGMSDRAQVVTQLTTRYGGTSSGDADEDGLFDATYPILHAALGGNPSMFRMVLHAMRKPLSPSQVKEALLAKDLGGRTMLIAAARSGSLEVFEAVLEVIKIELTRREVEKMMVKADWWKRTLLMHAIERCSAEVFMAILGVLRDYLPATKFRNMMVAEDEEGCTILTVATRGNFNFTKTIVSEDDEGRKMWTVAARGMMQDSCEAVLAALEDNLQREEVQNMLRKSVSDRTLLMDAVHTGTAAVFETALKKFYDYFSTEEVGKVMSARHHGRTILTMAARVGNRDTFEAVLSALESEPATRNEVKSMLMDREVLRGAALSGNTHTWEAVLKAARERLTVDQLRGRIPPEEEQNRRELLAAAVSSMDATQVKVVLDFLNVTTWQEMVAWTEWDGNTLLMHAASTGSAAVFKTVYGAFRDNLSAEELKEAMMRKNSSDTMLSMTADSESKDNFEAVMAALEDNLTPAELSTMLMAVSKGDTVLTLAASSESKDAFEAVVDACGKRLTDEQVHELMQHRNGENSTLMSILIESMSVDLWNIGLKLMKPYMQEHFADKQVVEALEAGLGVWTEAERRVRRHPRRETTRAAKVILSSLLEHGARPSHSFLVELSREKSLEWLKEVCLGAVTSARNPFIPGMTLSVKLASAAGKAPEGERRNILFLQDSVDALLLELLERLPQTVRGFDGLLFKILKRDSVEDGMGWLSAVFEPETSATNPTGPGPLGMALRERKQMETFCTMPLVMDFLSRRFTWSLPDLWDADGILDDYDELLTLTTDGLVLDHEKLECTAFILERLQGANEDKRSLTILPGAQFIAAGLAGRPNDYYRMPAMRMVLDLVVYLAMLAVFSVAVLFHEDGAVTTGEWLYLLYIVAAACAEGRQMKRGISIYSRDVWNFVDVAALVLLLGGYLVRVFDSSNPWGRGLYAMSAPLLFARILFFAQILRFQGPMVQVIFSMSGQLVQFGLVMVVFMIGFAVSFVAVEEQTFGVTLLTLFKVMLGDTAFFEDFDEDTHETVATVLLALYLVVFTIVLLNLLIAVLSTSHAQVEENAEREFKVSKARLIQHYRLVVDEDLLPAPFNLLQLVLSSPFLAIDDCRRGKAYSRAKRRVGQGVFWLVMGPVAVACGTLLWVVSAPYSPFAAYENFSENEDGTGGFARAVSFLLWILQLLLWCFLGGPFCLLALWPLGPCLSYWGWKGGGNPTPTSFLSTPRARAVVSVNDMLREAPGKLRVVANDLHRFLEDPMSDPEVRQDELNRVATVEHIKLLRDRLEAEVKGHVDKKMDAIERRVRKVKEEGDEVSRKMSGKLEEVGEKLEAVSLKLEHVSQTLEALAMKDLAPGVINNPATGRP